MKSILFISALLIIIGGCRDVVPVDSYSGLRGLIGEEITFITKDSTVYIVRLNKVYSDSMHVTGKLKNNFTYHSFNGSILFKDVIYIQTGNDEILPPYVIVIANSYFLTYGMINVLDGSSLSSNPVIIYPGGGGGGSCPFLYSWNGKDYVLEGETFGTALGKALETETAVVLNSLRPSDGKLKIKFTNERPETHFFNNINLYGVKVNADDKIYADSRNLLRVVRSPMKILSARDRTGKDIISYLSREDEFSWKSDLTSGYPAGNFEDVLYVDINPTCHADSLSLIISSINSNISDIVFKYLVRELGIDYTSFLHAAETDPSVIKILKDLLERCALKAEVWDGYKWIPGDILYPEANVAPFTKVLRLPQVKDQSGIMHIRLKALTGLWEINQILFDESKLPLPDVLKPELITAANNIDKIQFTDHQYIKLLPGEELILEYKMIDAGKNEKIIYGAIAGGYLYEYLLCTGTENQISERGPESTKLRILKKLLNEQDLLLSMIYNQYRNEQKDL